MNNVLTNNSQGTVNNGVDTNEYTYNLRVFRFNFTIPADNYIWGVKGNILNDEKGKRIDKKIFEEQTRKIEFITKETTNL